MLIKSFHWHFFFFFFLNTPLSSSRQAFKERASKSGFGSWNPVFTEILNQRVLSGVPVVALPWAIWALRRHWEASLCLGVHGDLSSVQGGQQEKQKMIIKVYTERSMFPIRQSTPKPFLLLSWSLWRNSVTYAQEKKHLTFPGTVRLGQWGNFILVLICIYFLITREQDNMIWIMLNVSSSKSKFRFVDYLHLFLFPRNEYFIMSESVLRFLTDTSLQFLQAVLQFGAMLSKAFNLCVTHNHYKPFTNICQAFINWIHSTLFVK